MNDTVRVVHEILGPYAAAKGVQLSVGREWGSLAVRADPVQLQQVVLNLAMNAVEAIGGSNSRATTVVIQTARVDPYTAEISVADSGAGIPADRLELIFEPFFTTKHEGTGLGLSIARAIVENHGGMIWAENLPQGGAMLRLTLPFAIALPT